MFKRHLRSPMGDTGSHIEDVGDGVDRMIETVLIYTDVNVPRPSLRRSILLVGFFIRKCLDDMPHIPKP